MMRDWSPQASESAWAAWERDADRERRAEERADVERHALTLPILSATALWLALSDGGM